MTAGAGRVSSVRRLVTADCASTVKRQLITQAVLAAAALTVVIDVRSDVRSTHRSFNNTEPFFFIGFRRQRSGPLLCSTAVHAYGN